MQAPANDLSACPLFSLINQICVQHAICNLIVILAEYRIWWRSFERIDWVLLFWASLMSKMQPANMGEAAIVSCRFTRWVGLAILDSENMLSIILEPWPAASTSTWTWHYWEESSLSAPFRRIVSCSNNSNKWNASTFKLSISLKML